jgi:hypothetical protein
LIVFLTIGMLVVLAVLRVTARVYFMVVLFSCWAIAFTQEDFTGVYCMAGVTAVIVACACYHGVTDIGHHELEQGMKEVDAEKIDTLALLTLAFPLVFYWVVPHPGGEKNPDDEESFMINPGSALSMYYFDIAIRGAATFSFALAASRGNEEDEHDPSGDLNDIFDLYMMVFMAGMPMLPVTNIPAAVEDEMAAAGIQTTYSVFDYYRFWVFLAACLGYVSVFQRSLPGVPKYKNWVKFSNFAFIEIPFLVLRIYGRLVYHLPVTAMMIKNMAELLDLAGSLGGTKKEKKAAPLTPRQANFRSELLPNSDDEEMQALPHTDDAEAHADEEDAEEEPETVTE